MTELETPLEIQIYLFLSKTLAAEYIFNPNYSHFPPVDCRIAYTQRFFVE